MSQAEKRHPWVRRGAAVGLGVSLAIGAQHIPELLNRGGTHTIEVKPQQEEINYEEIKALGFLQLLQRDMTGSFTLVARDHYKTPIFNWHYDPSPKVIGEVQDFKAKGQSYTTIDFKEIQIIKRQVMIDGKMVEQVEAILPEVKIGGSNITQLDDSKNPQNGLIDAVSQRGNNGDKIKGKDMFNLADRDFKQKALEDKVLKSASEAYAQQLIADFEAKQGFSFVKVSFANSDLPALEVTEAQLSDGVEAQKRLVNLDGTPQAFKTIQDIINEANARVVANKAAHGGKYVSDQTKENEQTAGSITTTTVQSRGSNLYRATTTTLPSNRNNRSQPQAMGANIRGSQVGGNYSPYR